MVYHVVDRLQDAVGTIEEVMKICQTPSVSFGVAHHGKVIFRKSIGSRDVERKLEANPDSVYMLGSCSKMITSTAVAKLVAEGKLQWLDPIQKYLPEFDAIGDSEIGRKADIIDALRHSVGLSDPTALLVGPRNVILQNDENFVKLLNSMATNNSEGQRFNRHWMYSNGSYGLIAKVVERVVGCRYSDFVKEQILKPLGMTRTFVSRRDLAEDDNVAYPYAPLNDGTLFKVSTESWPCENHSPILAATGMASSLNDALTWTIAVLSAERQETQSKLHYPKCAEVLGSGPLKQMTKVRKAYWTRPTEDEFKNEAAYCMGWIRVVLPSSILGGFSGNFWTRKDSNKLHLKNILGVDSPNRLAIGHNGGMRGSLSAIWTFPETESAVVVLTNGRGHGDASDFVAQILIQALFDLQPHVDMIPWARKEAELGHKWVGEELIKPWEESQRNTERRRDQRAYTGEYHCFDGEITLDVVVKSFADGSEPKLAVVFNRRPDTTLDLECCGKDAYTFFPGTWDQWLMASLACRKFENSVLDFVFNEGGSEAEGVRWLCTEEETYYLKRRK